MRISEHAQMRNLKLIYRYGIKKWPVGFYDILYPRVLSAVELLFASKAVQIGRAKIADGSKRPQIALTRGNNPEIICYYLARPCKKMQLCLADNQPWKLGGWCYLPPSLPPSRGSVDQGHFDPAGKAPAGLRLCFIYYTVL